MRACSGSPSAVSLDVSAAKPSCLDPTAEETNQTLQLLQRPSNNSRGSPACGCGLEALALLREDLIHREQMVQDRENRVWGWRLVAVSREAELEAELRDVEAREHAVQDRENAIRVREAELCVREQALEARAIALREEYANQTQSLRQEIVRLRSRFDSGVAVGAKSSC